MTYDSIPIPQINFADFPESEAKVIAEHYFKSEYNIFYELETARSEINRKLCEQIGRADRIAYLSYLINKLTERIVTLSEPTSERQMFVRSDETLPTYRGLLHFLYRSIEKEDISIPTDLFTTVDYIKAQEILSNIDKVIEQLKADNPELVEQLTVVQEEVKKANKFLWLGKEEWAKMVIGALVTTIFKEGISHFLPSIMLVCQTFFLNLLN